MAWFFNLLNQYWSSVLSQLMDIPWAQPVVLLFADVPIFFVPIFLIWRWFAANRRKDLSEKHDLLVIFYAAVLGGVIDMIIQSLLYIERPASFLQNKWMFILSHIPNASFPSDHATIGTAFLVGLYLFGYRKTFFCILPLFVSMFLARVIWGVHWPLDIVGGMVVGVISGWIFYNLKDTRAISWLNVMVLRIVGKMRL